MEKIRLYINGDVVMDRYNTDIINTNFLEALSFMYKRWPYLIEVNIFDCPNREKLSTKIDGLLDVNYCRKAEIPSNINKMYHLIDRSFDALCKWDNLTGKAIAFDYAKNSKQVWEGLKMQGKMTKDEYISVFRKAMHLYD